MAAVELLEPVNFKGREMKGAVVYAGSISTEGCCIEERFRRQRDRLQWSRRAGSPPPNSILIITCIKQRHAHLLTSSS